MLGIRIIREKTYRHLLKFKSEVEEILKNKLPIISDKTLKNKNINLSRGLVLVNSSIQNCNIKYSSWSAISALYKAIISNNIFTGKK